MPITTTGAGEAVGVGSVLLTPYDVGTLEAVLATPFDLVGPPLTGTLVTPFNIEGSIGSTLATPFSLIGPLGSVLTTPFDVVADAGTPVWGSWIEPPATPVSVTLAASCAVGDTTVTVTSSAGLVPGQMIKIGSASTYIVVASIAGPVLTLATPMPVAYASGTAVASMSGFLPLMTIFDKGGRHLGAISTFSVTAAPTHALKSRRYLSGAEGSLKFHVPRTLKDGVSPNPDAAMLKPDRLIALKLETNDEVWAGSLGEEDDSSGIVEMTAHDLWNQFVDTPAIVLDETVPDGTTGASLIEAIIALSNARKAADNELTWSVDASGSRRFLGKLTVNGDVVSSIETVIQRAGIEVMWTASMGGGALSATLVVRDEISSSGPALFDGPGGNIVASPTISRDPTGIVTEIHVVGQPTNLADCLPDYAQMGIANITPEVTVSVDPGPYRRRARLEVGVDFGLAQSEIDRLCSSHLDAVWELYYSFLRAVHDIEGRPFHEGYLFEGPPDGVMKNTNQTSFDVLSRRMWRTRLQLVETFPDTPASAVMITDQFNVLNNREWWVVQYNRQTGQQGPAGIPFPSVAGAGITRWDITGGTTTIYLARGGRIYQHIAYGPVTTGSYVDSYNIRLYDPISKRYRSLRRILNGHYALVGFLDPADPDLTFVDLPAVAAIDAGERSQLIGKIYDFELYNISKWSPGRDGVGEFKVATTIFNGAETTMARWHIVSYNVGNDASTSLVQGLSATDTTFEVVSILGFPNPEDSDFPFKIQVDESLAAEVMLVVAARGTEWDVVRAQDGTSAIIHEPGASVRRVGAAGATPTIGPTDYSWPDGLAYANELLAMLSQPKVTVGLHIVNAGDLWRQVQIGSVCPITIATEGAGTFTGNGRVIGRAPDGVAGVMEVVLEVTET